MFPGSGCGSWKSLDCPEAEERVRKWLIKPDPRLKKRLSPEVREHSPERSGEDEPVAGPGGRDVKAADKGVVVTKKVKVLPVHDH